MARYDAKPCTALGCTMLNDLVLSYRLAGLLRQDSPCCEEKHHLFEPEWMIIPPTWDHVAPTSSHAESLHMQASSNFRFIALRLVSTTHTP